MTNKLFPLALLSTLSSLALAACGGRPSTAPPAHTETKPAPRRGFVVMVAEHDRATLAKTPPSRLEPPILAVSSLDPTNAPEQSLSTSDGHYSIKVHWRTNGADASRTPCLDVVVSRRAKHPLPDADMHGCIIPNDSDTWLGEIASENGKALGAAVMFYPPNTSVAPFKVSSASAVP